MSSLLASNVLLLHILAVSTTTAATVTVNNADHMLATSNFIRAGGKVSERTIRAEPDKQPVKEEAIQHYQQVASSLCDCDSDRQNCLF